LVALLLLLAIALPLTRLFFFRKPSPPSPTATVDIQRRYWQDRIKNDVADKDAYLNLGILEERNGFYMVARRNLEAARLLGVPDEYICAPLGRTLTHLAESEKAKVELEKAVTLAPGKWEPVANLAGFYINNNTSSQANDVLTTFWNRVDRKTLSKSEKERLALAFLECNDAKNALLVSRDLLKEDPEYPGGQILVARSAFATENFTEAQTAMEAALKSTPDESAALYFYGLILQRLKDYDGALKVWQKANAINPAAPDVYEKIGEEYARRNEFKRASIALEKVAIGDTQINSALKTAEAYHQANDPINAFYWQAVAAGLQRDYAHALEFAQKAANTTEPIKKRRGLVAVAEAYRGMEKREEYLATILQATSGETVDDLLLRANAYQLLEKYDLYLAYLEQAIQKDPTREAELRYQRALILEKTGKRDEEEKELERAVDLNKKNPLYLQELSALYLKRSNIGGRLDKATTLIEQAIVLNADQEASWLTLGQCYAAKNKLGQAARCIEHSIDLEAGNGPAYLELGRIYARMGNTKGSQEMMQQYQKYVAFEQQRQTLRTKARRKGATASDITAYADLLVNIGDIQEALHQYENAYYLNPKDKALHNTLRILYKRLNLKERLNNLESTVL
jgi:tetratricopeptide (TPR) repeat protein